MRKPDGNLAFKVTWVYGQGGPFTTACTADGRDINIRRLKRVWCKEERCPCKQRGKGEPPVRLFLDKPCYDANIFREWRFGGGTFHNGEKKDTPRKILSAKVGKIAFYTTRHKDMTEDERIVCGAFRIGEITEVRGETIVVASAEGPHLKVDNFSKAPRYWEFHKQPTGPAWRTGLFRYVPDSEVAELLAALQKVAVDCR